MLLAAPCGGGWSRGVARRWPVAIARLGGKRSRGAALVRARAVAVATIASSGAAYVDAMPPRRGAV